MKRVFEGNDAVPVRLALVEVVPPRQLQHALHGLGAGVAEERACHAGELTQALRQSDVGLVVEVVGEVDHLARLPRDRGDEPRVRVPQGTDRDAAVHVEVALTALVPEFAALAARDHQGRLAVVGVEELRPEGDEVGFSGWAGHGEHRLPQSRAAGQWHRFLSRANETSAQDGAARRATPTARRGPRE